jgi:transcriptional regulator GlxA family with amidase domain
MTQIGRAIRWIRDHYAETVWIEDLADMAGMSLTSFHRHFLGVTSLSPLQFQKQIRLQEARSRLLSSSQDVAAVGFAVAPRNSAASIGGCLARRPARTGNGCAGREN